MRLADALVFIYLTLTLECPYVHHVNCALQMSYDYDDGGGGGCGYYFQP